MSGMNAAGGGGKGYYISVPRTIVPDPLLFFSFDRLEKNNVKTRVNVSRFPPPVSRVFTFPPELVVYSGKIEA